MAGSIPTPGTKCGCSRVVQADVCGTYHVASIASGHPICSWGGSSIGRAVDFGSTGSRFDSEPPRHSGIDQLADRLALTQQVPGSIPGPGTICYAGVVQPDRTLRYERRDMKVRILPPVPFSACRST